MWGSHDIWLRSHVSQQLPEIAVPHSALPLLLISVSRGHFSGQGLWDNLKGVVGRWGEKQALLHAWVSGAYITASLATSRQGPCQLDLKWSRSEATARSCGFPLTLMPRVMPQEPWDIICFTCHLIPFVCPSIDFTFHSLVPQAWNRQKKSTLFNCCEHFKKGGGGDTVKIYRQLKQTAFFSLVFLLVKIWTDCTLKKVTKKKEKKKIINCDLSFNSTELQMHPLSHWQADRVRTPTEQQSTVLLSCWWQEGFRCALFYNAMLGNIKNSKRNKREQGSSTRWIQQWGWFLKMSLKTVIIDAPSESCQTVPRDATRNTTAPQYILLRIEQRFFFFRRKVSDQRGQSERKRHFIKQRLSSQWPSCSKFQFFCLQYIWLL